MLDIKCRLCSSEGELISLFSGKCRKNRDYIRKLVETTIGIKFQKDDTFKCICYSCVVQVYNFYVFKWKSIDNEKILEEHGDTSKKKISSKIEIADLDGIIAPDIKELQATLAPWLISKQNYCETTNNEDNSEYNNKSITCEMVESGTQCDMVQSYSKSIQCHFPKDVSDKSTQSDSNKRQVSKYTQCIISNIAIHTQTNGISTKSSKIQCSLMQANEKKKRAATNATQTDNIAKWTQLCSTCETDCLCYLHNPTQVKQEVLALSPTKCLNISMTPRKSNVLSPSPTVSSPVSTSLLTVRSRFQNVINCQQCDQTFYSKTSYKLHKKSHLVCNFCRRKFPSMKRTKWHIANECDVRKMIKVEPFVQLTRLEKLDKVRKAYPKCLEGLSPPQKELRPVRLRSRSTSSMDSFHSNCSVCRNSLAVLHSLKLGNDKSVSAGTLLLENLTLPSCVCGEATLNSPFGNNEKDVPAAKRIKVSHKPV